MTRSLPHPAAEEAVIDTWGFHCGGCGKWRGRLGWYVPTDENGERLYCHDCAPTKPVECVDYRSERGTSEAVAWLWCRRGQHVLDVTGVGLGTSPHGFPKVGLRTASCDHSKPKPERTKIICAHCGETFVPSRSDARYCSGRCRVAANRAKPIPPV
jgi:hypothetical protein